MAAAASPLDSLRAIRAAGIAERAAAPPPTPAERAETRARFSRAARAMTGAGLSNLHRAAAGTGALGRAMLARRDRRPAHGHRQRGTASRPAARRARRAAPASAGGDPPGEPDGEPPRARPALRVVDGGQSAAPADARPARAAVYAYACPSPEQRGRDDDRDDVERDAAYTAGYRQGQADARVDVAAHDREAARIAREVFGTAGAAR